MKNVALALNDIKQSILNASWGAIWPEVIPIHNCMPIIEKDIVPIINLFHSCRQEGFKDLNANDIKELLTDEFTDDELINMISESLPAKEPSSNSD